MKRSQYIIGITGGSGVGKTTLIDILYKKFEGKISTLSIDDYYKPKELQALDSNGIINFDLPSALYTERLENDLNDLCNLRSVNQKVYQFNNPNGKDEYKVIEPNQILLVEGLFVMHYPFIREKLDYSVFLMVDEEAQLQRRLKRDVQERNYDKDEVMYQWNNHVLPAYRNYILPYKSSADLIITNNVSFDNNINELITAIERRMES